MVATAEKVREFSRELSIQEVAAKYGVHYLTVYRRILTDGLPARVVIGYGPNGKYMISESDLDDYLSRNPFRNRAKAAESA